MKQAAGHLALDPRRAAMSRHKNALRHAVLRSCR
jgi:hypothetical protein